MLKTTLTLAAICITGMANAATPNVCQTVQDETMRNPTRGSNQLQTDPTKSPIRAEVNPDKSVTFHFYKNNPPPITINGQEPLPNPSAKIDRNLQEYLHKRADSEYRRCMHDEQLKLHHPNRHPLNRGDSK